MRPSFQRPCRRASASKSDCFSSARRSDFVRSKKPLHSMHQNPEQMHPPARQGRQADAFSPERTNPENNENLFGSSERKRQIPYRPCLPNRPETSLCSPRCRKDRDPVKSHLSPGTVHTEEVHPHSPRLRGWTECLYGVLRVRAGQMAVLHYGLADKHILLFRCNLYSAGFYS